MQKLRTGEWQQEKKDQLLEKVLQLMGSSLLLVTSFWMTAYHLKTWVMTL